MKHVTIQNSVENTSNKDNHMPGRYVERPYTVAASVLAALLEGKELTARETGYRTRLSQAAELLKDDYGWRIDIRDSAIDVYAGRPARFKTYSLNAELIARAHQNGADSWLSVVKLARDLKYSKGCPAATEILAALREQLLRRKG